MEKADSKSKKAVKCIFDPVYFYIITSLCQFFSIIFAFITKRIKLCCENQGFWHIRKISCQKRCKIRVDPILGAAFIQIQIILHFHCSKQIVRTVLLHRGIGRSGCIRII